MPKIAGVLGQLKITVELIEDKPKPRYTIDSNGELVEKRDLAGRTKGYKYPKEHCKVCGGLIAINRMKFHLKTKHGLEIPYRRSQYECE